MFHTLPVDVLIKTMQFLSREDLVPLTQVDHQCASILKHPTPFYHSPLPSFHREEFNLNTYRKWLINRQFLVISSPDQLIAYSHSRIMTHATDIELRLDAYCQHPTTRPTTVTLTNSWFEDPTVHLNKALEKCLIDIRTSIGRFQHVRSLRLWYRPTSISPSRTIECSCTPGWITFGNWFIKISSLCLEIWSSKLISFELEMDPSYPCGRYALPAKIPRLSALQHLGLFFPPNEFYHLDDLIPESLSAFQFTSEESSVLIFKGSSEEQPDTNIPEAAVISRRSTNASQVLWTRCPVSIEFDVFQYLVETHQLRTDQSSVAQPFSLHHQHPTNIVRPIVPVQVHQLFTFTIGDCDLPPTMKLSERIAQTESQLEWVVDHFTRSNSNYDLQSPGRSSSPSLESLLLFDSLRQCYHSHRNHDKHYPINYEQFLHQLRHQLSIVVFGTATQCLIPSASTTGPFLDAGCNGCQVYPIRDQRWSCTVCTNFNFCQQCHQEELSVDGHDRTHPMTQRHERYMRSTNEPILPLSLIPKDVVDEIAIKQLQWSRLERFILRFEPWEQNLETDNFTPLKRETWIALERTLPTLESLGLSLGIVPLKLEPLSGVLLRIKHLDLFDSNIKLIPEKINLNTYCDYISSALTTVVTELRQLESLNLTLLPDRTYRSSIQWNEPTFLDSLTPLLLSSANLRRICIDTFNIQEYELNEFESKWHNPLFHLFGLWKLLQPTFEPPLDYDSVRTLFDPFVPSHAHYLTDMHFIHLKGRHEAESQMAQTPHAKNTLDEWKSWWTEWIHPDQVAHEKEIKRLNLIHQRSNTFQKILTGLNIRKDQLYQQHPHLTFQPRTFNLKLTYESNVVPWNLM